MAREPARRGWRASLEQSLLARWYNQRQKADATDYLLAGPAKLYRYIVEKRFRNRRPGDKSATIVIVGNITVGGTGKTPLLIELARQLCAKGFRVGAISRGYGGSHSNRQRGALTVSVDDSAAEVGDEALLIARQAKIPVVIARERRLALEHLLQSCELDFVLSDDGLQHYDLPRDYEIVALDGERGIGNGRLLPAGPMREPFERLAYADCIAVNGDISEALRSRLEPLQVRLCSFSAKSSGFRPLNNAARQQAQAVQLDRLPDIALQTDSIYMVAGIGHPQKFFSQLRELLQSCGSKAGIIEIAPGDHCDYSHGELDAIAAADPAHPALLLTTEKDAVKLADRAASWAAPVYAVGLELQLDASLLDDILACHLKRLSAA